MKSGVDAKPLSTKLIMLISSLTVVKNSSVIMLKNIMIWCCSKFLK